ncbi:hypothetical protein KRR55_16585 [Paeniglutamicibacter sp. ABSL32-1]|uniref:hypothetical protein n=1 Tax=Paeniglutamicibacter quisquiliarum TaxID=2849498 RepID=UPI001C2CDD4B|nr:hypothetical protein [Paeniglutamicibacter quisquiliarum]MBV1780734.1 hypothetical protein [Paeniglutamicibacter quisquiliarum]
MDQSKRQAKKLFKGFDPEAVMSLTSSLRSTAQDAVPKPKPQRKFSDPDARVRKRADRSFSYCYNGQALVDEHLRVIGAAEMNQATNDHGN